MPGSEVLIEGEVSEELVLKHRANALKNIQKNAEAPGFRKGHVPENILVERIGELTILGEAGEEALNEVFPSIIESEKLVVLGSPEVAITKLAPGNPLGFRMTVSVLPVVKLPNYKKIVGVEMSKDSDTDVLENDIEDVIKEIRKNFAHAKMHEGKDEHDHSHGEMKDEDLPEFNDDFVKTIGEFTDVADFRAKARENLKKEKEFRAREKKRMAALESVLAETEFSVPKALIESELAKMLAQFKDDVTRTGASYEEYIKHVNKTEEDIRKEWREPAEKKAKVQLIINKISEEEKIVPDSEKVRAETEKLLLAYQGVDPVRARAYVSQMMLNEKVMEFLEEQK